MILEAGSCVAKETTLTVSWSCRYEAKLIQVEDWWPTHIWKDLEARALGDDSGIETSLLNHEPELSMHSYL